MRPIKNLIDVDILFYQYIKTAINKWTWAKDNWEVSGFGYVEGSDPVSLRFSHPNPRFSKSVSDAEVNTGDLVYPYLVVEPLEPTYSDKKIYTDEVREYNSNNDSAGVSDITIYPPPVRMVFSYQVTAGTENYLDYSVVTNILRDRLFPMYQGNRWIELDGNRYILSITDTNTLKESNTGRSEYKITYSFEVNIYFTDLIHDFSNREVRFTLEQL